MPLELAVCGAGTINEPDFMATPHIDTGALVPILTEWQGNSFNMYARYRSRKFLSAKVRVFIDNLQRMEGGDGNAVYSER